MSEIETTTVEEAEVTLPSAAPTVIPDPIDTAGMLSTYARLASKVKKAKTDEKAAEMSEILDAYLARVNELGFDIGSLKSSADLRSTHVAVAAAKSTAPTYEAKLGDRPTVAWAEGMKVSFTNQEHGERGLYFNTETNEFFTNPKDIPGDLKKLARGAARKAKAKARAATVAPVTE